MTRFHALLEGTPIVLLDGAMGTRLVETGLRLGTETAEAWNLTHPQAVREGHRGYIQAGAQIILTNSLGANRFRAGAGADVQALNQAAARLARAEAGRAPHPVLVAGSIGPSGAFEPSAEGTNWPEVRHAFAEQAAALAGAGVDLLWIETMGDLDELRAAVEGVQQASDLPLVATLSFDSGGRTRAGVMPEAAMRAMQGMGLAAAGANCGASLAETETALRAMRRVDATIPLISKANAGLPRHTDEGWRYAVPATEMAEHATRILDMGVRLIGGCCGTTPAHISAMGEALKRWNGQMAGS